MESDFHMAKGEGETSYVKNSTLQVICKHNSSHIFQRTKFITNMIPSFPPPSHLPSTIVAHGSQLHFLSIVTVYVSSRALVLAESFASD
jgi:hypothetical protein